MKNILLTITFILILCGCNSHICNLDNCNEDDSISKLIELGYNRDAALKILSLKENNMSLLTNDYKKDYEKLLELEDFKEEYLEEYTNTYFDIDTFVYLINNKIYTKLDESFKEIYNDKFYIKENTEKYLQYKEEYSDIRDLVEYVNAKAYKKGYEEYDNSDTSKDILMIASKIYYLGEYSPNDLVDVEEGYYILSKPQLRNEAWINYKTMADAARNEGIEFYISTSFRSYDFQKTLYNGYLANDSQESVDTYSSRPGYSDHQTGLAADIRTVDEAFERFTDTKAAKWLKDNSYKYGFIQRYPDEKQEITGYIPESWHYRYVGKEAAKIIHENEITFDEYYAYYVENK